jgi:glycerophosphoryl diester phosphodiesterase
MRTAPRGDNAVGRAPAISAHRGGREYAPEGTFEAYRSALETGAAYLEFDVRRTADGELVAFHGARLGYRGRTVAALSHAELCRLAGYRVPAAGDILQLLAGRAAAHIDLKEPDCAAAMVSQALRLLEPAQMIVTTGDLAAARELSRRYPAVPVGVTVGGNLAETTRYVLRSARRRGVAWPDRGLAGYLVSRLEEVAAAKASWAVIHEPLARTGLLTECRERGLKTMVWTVNRDAALTRWLACPDVDILVSDRPGRAAALAGPAQSRAWPA